MKYRRHLDIFDFLAVVTGILLSLWDQIDPIWKEQGRTISYVSVMPWISGRERNRWTGMTDPPSQVRSRSFSHWQDLPGPRVKSKSAFFRIGPTGVLVRNATTGTRDQHSRVHGGGIPPTSSAPGIRLGCTHEVVGHIVETYPTRYV